jgi:pimeloyl-ACP methyl ester carboxylesterase
VTTGGAGAEPFSGRGATRSAHLEPAPHTLEVDGLHVHYLRGGRGAPLVLLHGFNVGSSRLTYGPSLAPLAERFDVIAPDLPGYGLSEAPDPFYTTGGYVRFLTRFLDALSVRRTYLIGFSKGGGIALGAALEHPERFCKLILVSSYALNHNPQLPLLPYLALRSPWLSRVFWRTLRRYRRLLPWYLKNVIFGDARKVTEQLLEEVREPLSREGSEAAFMAWLRGEIGLLRFRTDYREALGSLQVPTLLLHGTRDLVVPVRGARRAAQRIPNARLQLVPRCGHWLPREAPEALIEAATTFFGDQTLTAPPGTQTRC